MRFGVMLLALLLAAMAMVPMVNAYTPTDKEKIIRNVLPDINSEDLLYPKGPVFGDSINYLGCIEIYLHEDMSVNKTTPDKIYRIINSSGRDGESEDIPVIFIKARLPESDATHYPRL